MMRSSNPVLKTDTFQRAAVATPGGSAPAGSTPYGGSAVGHGDTMTISGTVNKTLIALAILFATAFYTWNMYFSNMAQNPYGEPTGGMNLMPLALGAGIGGFVIAIILMFKKTWAPVLTPLYAGLEGLFLGALSAVFDTMYPGIVIQAVGLTFLTLFSLLFVYKSGLIKVTENFKLGVAAATGGIALFYIVQMILGFFGIQIPYIHESGLIGIGFSVFVIVIAALNLVMDFDFIEEASQGQTPKYMEWVGAFGLLVTLIWLYIEFLRLLAKLQSRD